MFKAFRHFHRDERGMSIVMVGIGLMAFVAASSLAIDVGMMMTARTQAQTAADSGALAGATALVFNNWTDRSASGPAKQNAVNAARANVIMGASGSQVQKTVGPADVTFPASPSGVNNRVQVTVHRTTASGNAIPTFIAQMFGVPTVDIAATATAEASADNAMSCVKPFMIADKWLEKSKPPNSQFNLGTDIYIPADQTGYTGYSLQNDIGTLLMLRAGTGNQIEPSFYYSWDIPGGTGGSYYRDNLMGCNTTVVEWGDPLIQEPGNMVGPTVQGMRDLVAEDPDAYWDTSCKCVRGGNYAPYGALSPRQIGIPLYDPEYYAEGKASGRVADFKVANFMGFFVLPPQGNNVYGYLTAFNGVKAGGPGAPGPLPGNTLTVTIRLVK